MRHWTAAAVILSALVLLASACSSSGPVAETLQLDPIGERPTLVPVPTVEINAEFCADNQQLAVCEQLLDDLTDAEFCDLLPEDLFCERFFDPDAEPRSTEAGAGDESVTQSDALIPLDSGGSVRILPPADAEDGESAVLDGVDPLRRRDDGMCLPDDRLAVEGDVDYDVAYQVVNGQLGFVCHGIPDEAVEAAWSILVELSPPEYLTELAIFAGFFDNSNDGRAAFVRPVGEPPEREFLMATNLVSLDNDEYTIFTMAHEMSHVLTLRSSQLDATVPAFACPSYHSGNGCHLEGSILDRWVREFWSVERPDDLEARCDEDSGLLTAYAATNPHEDFAESFAAAVVGFRPESTGQDARFAFIANDPELAAFVERGRAAGYEAPRFILGVCG